MVQPRIAFLQSQSCSYAMKEHPIAKPVININNLFHDLCKFRIFLKKIISTITDGRKVLSIK